LCCGGRSPRGDRGPVAPLWATGGGPVALPAGDRARRPPPLLYISREAPFSPHLSPKNPPKIQKKKRGVRRSEAAKPCR